MKISNNPIVVKKIQRKKDIMRTQKSYFKVERYKNIILGMHIELLIRDISHHKKLIFARPTMTYAP